MSDRPMRVVGYIEPHLFVMMLAKVERSGKSQSEYLRDLIYKDLEPQMSTQDLRAISR